MDLNGHNQTLAGLFSGAESTAHNTLWDSVTNGVIATPVTLTIDNAADYDFEAIFTGSLSVSKYGAGTLTLGGNSINSGNVLVYDGTLQINGSTTANVQTVAGYGSPQITGNGDPKYWIVLTTAYGGPTSGDDSGQMLFVQNGQIISPDADAPLKVWAAGWQAAVELSVVGYATNTTNWVQSTFFFGTVNNLQTYEEYLDDNSNPNYNPSLATILASRLASVGTDRLDSIVDATSGGNASIPACGAFMVGTVGGGVEGPREQDQQQLGVLQCKEPGQSRRL